MNVEQVEQSKTRGRPVKKINWPNKEEFTAEDAYAVNPGTSRGCVQGRLLKSVESGELKVKKLSRKSKGRPTNIYSINERV
jgi:predicted ArsR family transcriptional regulator